MDETRRAPARPIPILRYLAVDPDPGDPTVSIDAIRFEEHLDALLDADFIPLSMRDLLTAFAFAAPVPRRSILITFDQGLRGFYDFALPALRDRDIPATVFVTTGFVGKQSRALTGAHGLERTTMSWSQLQDLEREDVVVGANGHSYWPLDVMSRWEAGEDLALSKSLLEHKLGRRVHVTAYPEGLDSSATRAAAQRVGYEAGCSINGTVSSNHDDLMGLSRLAIHGETRADDLIGLLEGMSRRVLTRGETAGDKVRRTIRRVSARATAEPAAIRAGSERRRRL